MLRKLLIWAMFLIAGVALIFIVTGCSKKQVVREEAAGRCLRE